MKSPMLLCSLMPALVILILSPARAQFIQQGSKLAGTGAVGNAQQGSSVSLSADGNTAIMGGPYDNANAGAAWAFTRNGGVWTQQGNKLVGTGAVGTLISQGFSVSLSADGNTAILGGTGDNSFVGAAWVFTRSAGVWTQQGSKLVGTGAVGGSEQGWSVSISADGNTVIVGGPYDSSQAGAAWVFTRSGGVWTQQGSKLVGTGAVGNAQQGASVSLSSDGNTAIVGGWRDNSLAGAAWVFTRSGGVWTQQGSKLVGTGAVNSPLAAAQGKSVSLSSDGNTAIEGGTGDSNQAGAAWIFTRSGGVWTQQGSKLVGTGAANNPIAARQGASVSLSSDGNTAIVGAPDDSAEVGATWVYKRTAGVWSQLGSKLVGTGAVGNAVQGWSVCLSGDGNSAIIGGLQDNSTAGASWVFMADKQKIISISDIPNDQGGSVRIKWNKFLYDSAGISTEITSYGIWRKVPAGISPTAYKRLIPPQELSVLADSLSQYDFLMTVPALQLPSYNAVVPTLADSTSGGIPYFTYIITGQTAIVYNYYISYPDSGYSVDNLAPIQPSGLVAAAQPGPQAQLSWNPPTDPDVGRYDIYRSTTDNFSPAPGLKIGTAFSPDFTDGTPTVGMTFHYRIIAVDVHGNQSQPSSEASATFPVTQTFTINTSWNMISVPLVPNDYTKSTLYPTAVSPAYTYQGSYVISSTLQSGAGYWLRFDGDQTIPITGTYKTADTVDVAAGWNMIGSISTSVPVTSVSSIPEGMITSQFFRYDNGYTTVMSIDPGSGYWVKVNGAGQLVLSSSPSNSPKITIRVISEQPPPPPDGEIGLLPREFSVEQNYPNPFNPSTTIHYELPSNSRVSIMVFNLLGQVVATLVNETEQAGHQQVNWNASNIASGIYFYRLEAVSAAHPSETFTSVKKLVLLK